MSEIEDLDQEFADSSEHTAIIDALWQEAALARRYGDMDPAIDAYRHIIDLDPTHAEARLGAAETCRLAGRPREALQFCLDLLEQDRQHMGCRLELAEALRQLGQAAESRSVLDILLMEHPDSIHVWCGLARLLADEGHLSSAEAALRRALGLHRGHAPAWAALGRILARGGEDEAALDAFHAASILEPEQPSHHVDLAETLLGFGRPDEATGHVARALFLDDEHAPAHGTNARLLMLHGRLAESWEAAKWRHRQPGAPLPLFPADPWEGQDLNGAALLLQADTGLADTLMLARFVPILAGQGAVITLVVHPELVPLLASLPGVARILPLGEELPDDLDADFTAFLGDLPGLLGIGLSSIASPPYLKPPPRRIRRIRIPAGIQVKAGIAWAGESDRDCLPFAQVLDLANVPGTLLFSLQTGPRAAEARRLADPGLITDLAPTVADFADLAGRIAEMDLVIATDGPTAHLAAAIGKPVLLLLPHAAHPRWMRDRDDSPWYPGMVLLRQPAPGQWPPVLAEAQRRLEELARETRETHARQRQSIMGDDAACHAFLAAHAAPGDLLLDVAAGNGEFVFSAMDHCPDLLVIALEPSPTEAGILRDSLAIAGLEEQVEIIPAAAGAAEGHALASRQKRNGCRVFALPGWVPAATPILPLARLLDERPQLASCRIMVRIGQSGWETEIVAGLAGRAALIILEHREGRAASEALAEAGYGLWCFPQAMAHGALVPFKGAPGPVLALAPGLAPASHYGPTSLPPSPALIAAEEVRAMSLASTGPALQAEGRVGEAANLYSQALAADPFCAMANANLAVLQHMAGKHAAAIAGFTRALSRSRHPAVMVNLAAALRRDGRLSEAESLLQEAMAEDGRAPNLLHDMALLRRDQGRLAEAQTLMRQACAMAPGRQGFDWALAQILLGSGNLAEGLPLLAHRPTLPSRAPELPQWDGGDIVATSLLVEANGDILDGLLLARFLPPLAGRGALVTLTCPDELAPLLADLAGVEQVISSDDPLPPCEMRTTLAALPGLLGITDALGAARSGGYVVAGRGRRSGRDDRLRVGLTWGGQRGGQAACHLGDLLALGVPPTLSLLALADEDDLEQIELAGADCLVERPLPQPTDLAEMAALISGLDVVVGGDTVPLHLAAALGKPVIALLPHGFNWRWPEGRDDSPWHASARVFRPDANGNWRTALRRVAQALAVMAERKEPGLSG